MKDAIDYLHIQGDANNGGSWNLFEKVFNVKKLQFVYSDMNKEAIMVLIKAIKNGKSGSLKIMPPIDISSLKSYKGIFERGDNHENDSRSR